MLLSFIILSSLEKMQGERSVYGPYYILQGKPSIQTIQDADLYQLSAFYGIYKRLKKQDYQTICSDLSLQSYIQIAEDEKSFQVTSKARIFIKEQKEAMHTYHFHGKRFKQIDTIFYQRLLLFVQVLTHSKHNSFHYIPIVERIDITRWMKGYYPKVKHRSDEVLISLHDELQLLLQQLEVIDATIFVEQLTAYGLIGQTITQLSDQYDMSYDTIYLKTISVIHFILAKLMADKGKYPVLASLIIDLQKTKQLSISTEKTANLLKQNKSLIEIAQIRQLKMNTIYDHIVEIALHHHDFTLDRYLTEEQESNIMAAINKIKSYKLKELKALVSADITYFQIRLVLAKITRMQGE